MDNEDFVMVHRRDLSSTIDLVRQRHLEPRDMAVLTAMLCEMDSTGRCRVTVAHLAERLGIQRTHCSASISRLRQQMILARVRDQRSGSTHFLLNPYVASVGGPQRRNHLWQQFQEALE